MGDDDRINVAAAFTPFDADEIRDLQEVQRWLTQLVQCEFFKQGVSYSMKGSPGEPVQQGMTHAGERDLGEMLRLMRPFYASSARAHAWRPSASS